MWQRIVHLLHRHFILNISQFGIFKLSLSKKSLIFRLPAVLQSQLKALLNFRLECDLWCVDGQINCISDGGINPIFGWLLRHVWCAHLPFATGFVCRFQTALKGGHGWLLMRPSANCLEMDCRIAGWPGCVTNCLKTIAMHCERVEGTVEWFNWMEACSLRAAIRFHWLNNRIKWQTHNYGNQKMNKMSVRCIANNWL